MGNCLSAPPVNERPPAAAGPSGGGGGGGGDASGDARAAAEIAPPSPRSGGAPLGAPPGAPATPVTGEGHRHRMEAVVAKVYALQQELALVSPHALLALPESAELLGEHLGVDVVGIYAYSDDTCDTQACAALMAAHGHGAAVLERRVVLRAGGWSPMRLRAQACAGGGGDTARLYVPDAVTHEGELPDDFAELCMDAGLRSLAAATIGPPGGEPLGCLLLGKRAPGGFDDQWASMSVSAAATSLLQHVRQSQVGQAARMIQIIDEAQDPVSAISVLLQSGVRFMWRATNVSMGVRLALVEEGAESALVFESTRATSGKDDAAGFLRARSSTLASDPLADVVVREVPLANTLLASAVSMKKARFVRDAASYMQNCPAPARDVFTHATQPVSSVVVVPLLVADQALGALYFTQDTPCDFSNMQDALLGFVHCVTLALHHKLAGEMGTLKGMADHAHSQASKSFDLAAQARGAHLIREVDGGGDSDTCGDASDSLQRSCGDLVPPLASSTSLASGRLSKVSSRRLCTEAMLKVLQQEIRKGKRRSVELSFVGDHLVISEEIGHGGFGRVFRGSWHKRPAAIKVMNARHSDSEAVSDAMEMAVLLSVQHPSIVQVYSCLTDMVEVPAGAHVNGGSFSNGGSASAGNSFSSGGAPQPMPSYRRMQAGEDGELPTCNIIVMEFCSRGTLGDAVKRDGLFHRRLDDGAIGVDLPAVMDILLDIANSLEYLHGISLLHGDVKLDNVLLKSDPMRPLGVAPKLADFGLTKILRDTEHVVNHNGAGTITHLAPEMFQPGTRLTTAVDTYAFGVLMWEFYAAQRPYAGLTRDAITDHVVRKGGRPQFPPGAPRAYVDLATACWAHSPVDRPAVADIISSLQALSESLFEPAGGGGGGGVRAPPAAPAAAAAAAAAALAAAGAFAPGARQHRYAPAPFGGAQGGAAAALLQQQQAGLAPPPPQAFAWQQQHQQHAAMMQQQQHAAFMQQQLQAQQQPPQPLPPQQQQQYAALAAASSLFGPTPPPGAMVQ